MTFYVLDLEWSTSKLYTKNFSNLKEIYLSSNSLLNCFHFPALTRPADPVRGDQVRPRGHALELQPHRVADVTELAVLHQEESVEWEGKDLRASD